MFNRRRFLSASAGFVFLPRALQTWAATPLAGSYVNPFAMKLYGELCRKDGNVFCSPYSISTALAMTAAGARGETLAQMQKVLGLGVNPVDSDTAFASLAKALDGKGKGLELAVANALWAQPGYPWNPVYTKRVADVFKAAVHDTDYRKDPEACRKTINDWVEKQTMEKIKDLMPRDSIDRMTRLVLTNAIYFKGDWIKAFDKSLTKDAPFTKLDGTKQDVPLMFRKGMVQYAENDTAQVIRLPYKGNEVSFIAALPRKPGKFAELESKFEQEVCQAKFVSMPDVQLWLPKFKVETRYELNGTLKAMGMPDAFDNNKADFSAMVTTKSDLVISIVVHKAYVDVNEEGTEAAAATGVGMKIAAPIPQEPRTFRADRPFLFALRHEPTGTLMFLGRYVKPA